MRKNVIFFEVQDKVPIIHERNLESLGIGYLESALLNKGFSIDICPKEILDFDKNSSEKLIKYLINTEFDIAAISTTTDTFVKAVELAKMIKSLKKSPVVLGGYHATLVGGENIIRTHPCFDYIIEGEGEEVLPGLVLNILYNKNIDNLPGIIKLESTKAVVNLPYKLIENLDDINFPVRRIRNGENSHFSIITSRGCSHRCSFCSVAAINRGKYRMRSISNVIEEVYSIVQQYGENINLHFIDDNFFVDDKRAHEIIRILHCKYPKMKFTFATRADQIIKGEKSLNHLYEYNCNSVELGIENGSVTMLERYNKQTTPEENLQAINILRKNNINIGVDYIMFDYLTTIEELKENIEFIRNAGLWGYYPQFISTILTIYPGTQNSYMFFGKKVSHLGFKPEFINANTEEVYRQFYKFITKEKLVHSLMDTCIRGLNNGVNVKLNQIFIYKLRSIAYDYFKSLVYCERSSDMNKMWNNYEQEINKINKYLMNP